MSVLFALAACSLALLLLRAVLNPLRRPTREIEKKLTRLTPLGSDKDDVIQAIRDKFGEDVVSYAGGFERVHAASTERRGWSEVVGSSSLKVYLGEYRWFILLGVTSVTVFWAFDEDDRLIEVWVRKTRVSL
ncbi:MAG: hypothetical protein ACI8W8_003362 [Rhodothermales bacterium]|jgi:hypothetical protein